MTMRMVRCLGLPENLTMSTVLSYRIVVEIVFTSHLTENIKTSAPKIIETRKEESRCSDGMQKITQTRKG